jgi:hypothetical protein
MNSKVVKVKGKLDHLLKVGMKNKEEEEKKRRRRNTRCQHGMIVSVIPLPCMAAY